MNDQPQQLENGRLLDSARELRSLLLDYIAGGPAQAPRYKALRDALLAAGTLQSVVPPLLSKHEKLDDLWYAMKYQVASKVERQELIRKEFEPLLAVLAGEAAPRPAEGFEAVSTEQLLKGWLRLNQQTMEPSRRLRNGVNILVQVCCSVVDAHYASAEIRGGNTDLAEVFQMANDVLFASSAETDLQIQVADTVAGAGALLKALERARERFSNERMPEAEQALLARNGADLALASAMALLSGWHMLKDRQTDR